MLRKIPNYLIGLTTIVTSDLPTTRLAFPLNLGCLTKTPSFRARLCEHELPGLEDVRQHHRRFASRLLNNLEEE